MKPAAPKALDAVLQAIDPRDVTALRYALAVAGQAELAAALLERRRVLLQADEHIHSAVNGASK